MGNRGKGVVKSSRFCSRVNYVRERTKIVRKIRIFIRVKFNSYFKNVNRTESSVWTTQIRVIGARGKRNDTVFYCDFLMV